MDYCKEYSRHYAKPASVGIGIMLSMGGPDQSRGIAQQIVGDSYRGHLVDVANNVQKVTIPTL